MARHQSNFSADQRAAVVASVAAGMSARSVAAAAFAGELGGLPSFNISPSSVSAFAREDRAERDGEEVLAGSGEIRDRIRDIDSRLLDLAEAAVAELAEAEGEIDLSRTRQTANLVKAVKGAIVPAPPGGQSAAAERPPNLLERLAAGEASGDGDNGDNGLAA